VKKIGVLALQGDFDKHIRVFNAIGADSFPVRTEEEVALCEALVIPGGESTTIGKLLDSFSLVTPLRERIVSGLPVFSTCAGTILLAQEICNSNQIRLSVLEIEIERNAYGRQVESFEADIAVPVLGEEPVKGVFIRAPIIKNVGAEVEILSRYEDKPVIVKKGNILAVTFHPELTSDYRLQRYFVKSVFDTFSAQKDLVRL
jgi:5'-phosphate synthase pdxT subunit